MISVIGNPTLDTIIISDSKTQKVGGPPSYIDAALKNTGIEYKIVGKVGKEFPNALYKNPITVDKPTTQFVLKYREGGRDLENPVVCESIYPSDIVESKISLVSMVSGEVLPETLEEIIKKSGFVIVDIQGFIRKVESGKVMMVDIKETAYSDVIKKVDIIKASEEESKFLDIDDLRNSLTVIITKGRDGCEIITKDNVMVIPTRPEEEIDPTGAGDMFIGGLGLALSNDYNLEDACSVANKFGAFAVKVKGVPEVSIDEINRIFYAVKK